MKERLTPTEAALIRLQELKNEISDINGAKVGIDIEKYKECYLKSDVRKNKCYEVEEQCNRYESMLQSLKDKKAKKESADSYFSTEEGKSKKEASLKRLEELKESYLKEKERMTNSIMDIVKRVLGDSWIPKYPSLSEYGCRLTLQKMNGDNKVQWAEIELCYEVSRWEDRKESLTTNIGSTGGFEMDDTSIESRAMFYRDLGVLLSNQNDIEAIKNIFKNTSKCQGERAKEAEEINSFLENPLG